MPLTPQHVSFLISCVPGVFFYLSSAVNPIIYNLLSRRFRAAFWNVISPCKQGHSQHHQQGPPAHRNIFLTECHLVELTEDAGPQFPCQLTISSSHPPTALCSGQAPWKGHSKSWHSFMPPYYRKGHRVKCMPSYMIVGR